MRIRLRKGFQTSLVEAVKAKSGLSWKELGQILGLSETYLKYDLRNEYCLLSQNIYQRLCKFANKNYDSKIIEKLGSNWGQVKGGKNSPGSQPKKPILLANKYSIELAEIFGIMLGDGNSWSKTGYYYIRVAGHLQNDKDYLTNYVKALFKKAFRIDMQILHYNKINEIFLQKGSKNLVFTLKKFGFPSGDKIRNRVKIPNWIFKNKSYLKACIRGLIDTDGSVCPITNRNYPYIWFKSYNPALRDSFSKAMKLLGIKIAKWSSNESSQTYIGAKPDIGKYYKEIGFSNPYHRKRYESYAPVVQRPISKPL